MATYDQNWPADTLVISDIPGTIREKGRQLKDDGIVKPAAHKSSHAVGGTDALTPADIGAVPASDVSTTAAANKIIKANASGLLPVSITGNAATAGDATTVGGKAASAFFPNLTYYTGDLNNLSTPGLYQVNSAVVTNEPEATWGSVYVSYISTTNWVQQLWVGQVGNIWVRRSYDSSGVRTWDAWKRMAFISDIPAVNPHGIQVFKSSGTFIVPSGVTTILVSLSGGGGGGSGGGRYNGGGGGGCAQAINNYPVTVTPGEAITVTVGSGGTGGGGGKNYGSAGGAGGSSSFGSYITVVGGGGGYPTTSNSSWYGHGGTSYYLDGHGSNGGFTYKLREEYYEVSPGAGGGDVPGPAGSSPSGNWGGGGGAGKSISCYTTGGAGGAGSSGTGGNGAAGGIYGSGGGGGGSGYSGTGGTGGAGAQGYVLIEW